MSNSENPRTGSLFEIDAQKYLGKILNIELQRKVPIEIGVSIQKKVHNFDLGSVENNILIECKRHTWTATNNSPSAKFSVWNEAMFYFSLAGPKYKKILFVFKSINTKNKKSLAETYVHRNGHLIPKNTEIWEFDSKIHLLKHPIK